MLKATRMNSRQSPQSYRQLYRNQLWRNGASELPLTTSETGSSQIPSILRTGPAGMSLSSGSVTKLRSGLRRSQQKPLDLGQGSTQPAKPTPRAKNGTAYSQPSGPMSSLLCKDSASGYKTTIYVLIDPSKSFTPPSSLLREALTLSGAVGPGALLLILKHLKASGLSLLTRSAVATRSCGMKSSGTNSVALRKHGSFGYQKQPGRSCHLKQSE